MSVIRQLYGRPSPLLTDLYQLTMALAHHRCGTAEREAVFHLFVRRGPFGGQAMVAAGLDAVAELVEDLRFAPDELAHLATLRDPAGGRLFDDGFLDRLATLRASCDIDAVPEGTVVFPHEPILRVRGPVMLAQMLQTALLNLVNYPTLIATKAARIVQAAAGDPVLDFGLRKAHGIDGAVSCARAAYVGGCAATSNVLAGRLFDIPVRGTHAHGWVMAFDSEPEAFAAWARALPGNAIFLVDTYDSEQGIRHAIEAARLLQASGHRMLGIRLDSGDLAALARRARRLLDEAGLQDARIVASSGLDEQAIARLKRDGAPIAVWGVGTRLATGHPDGALDGVYKLGAIRGPDGQWHRRAKRSDTPAKRSMPGVLQLHRLWRGDEPVADLLSDALDGPPDPGSAVDRDGRPAALPDGLRAEPLLVPLIRDGRRVAPPWSAAEARERALAQYPVLAARGDYPLLLSLSLQRRAAASAGGP